MTGGQVLRPNTLRRHLVLTSLYLCTAVILKRPHMSRLDLDLFFFAYPLRPVLPRKPCFRLMQKEYEVKEQQRFLIQVLLKMQPIPSHDQMNEASRTLPSPTFQDERR